jgi:hypothetical protein
VSYSTTAVFIEGIDLKKTILRKVQNRLCITNGCYGKFHRQMTHIAHKMAAKK